MNDHNVIEILCKMQDLNKNLRLNSISEEEVKQCDRVEDDIQEQFKSLYVN